MEQHLNYVNVKVFMLFSLLSLSIFMLALGQNGNNDVYAQLLQQQQPPVSTMGDNATSSGLKFTLKYEGNQSAVQAPAAGPAKQLTINVTVQQGPDSPPMTLPINAKVPQSTNPEDLQLCASIGSGQEQCQPLSEGGATAGGQGTTIDLTQQGATTMTPPPSPTQQPPPASPMPQSSDNIGNGKISSAVFTISPSLSSASVDFSPSMSQFYVPVSGSLIGIEDTTLYIPVTVIAPINVQVQNAQICASLLSGGDQTCTQVVMNPEQTSFIPIDVDLTTPTPTLTTEDATAPMTTTAPEDTLLPPTTDQPQTAPAPTEQPEQPPAEQTTPSTTEEPQSPPPEESPTTEEQSPSDSPDSTGDESSDGQ